MEFKLGNNYQFGHCHYFAKYLKRVFEELLPNKDIEFHLVLGHRYDDEGENIDDVLIHAYVKIDDNLIDSEGVFTIEEASKREKEWSDVEKDLTPDGYDFESYEETTDDIPEIFFNKFCSTKHLKKDVSEFIKRKDVMNLINELK
jgi:hypothetical protein